MKILVTGCCRSDDSGAKPLVALSERLRKVHTSAHGPFDFALVTGYAIHSALTSDAASASLYLSDLASFSASSPDAASFPLPTYVLTPCLPTHTQPSSTASHDEAASPCARLVAAVRDFTLASPAAQRSNLNLLHGGGVTTLHDFNCVYCGDDSEVTGVTGVVDFLLTSTPPSDSNCSLALTCRPRYHFTVGVGFTQRPPYLNSGGMGIVTRLVALADATPASSGKGDLKCVHALNLEPASGMSSDALQALCVPPPGSVPCPYTPTSTAVARDEGELHTAVGMPVKRARMDPSLARVGGAAAAAAMGAGRQAAGSAVAPQPGPYGKALPPQAAAFGALTPAQMAALTAEHAGAGEQFFWNLNAHRGGGRGGRGGGRGGGGERRPPPACWFCLASPQVEKHLVVSVATEAYLALPKGGIDDSHVLIVPIAHHDALATSPPGLRADVASFLECLTAMFAAQGKALMAFERVLHARRGETPIHTHMQVVGIPLALAAEAKAAWMKQGEARGIPFQELTDSTSLATAVAAPGAAHAHSGAPAVSEYLYVEVPDGAPAADGTPPKFARLLHHVPVGALHPMQFGREVTCALLGKPERLTWKTCVSSTADETAAAATFRAAFAPYDFTQTLDA